MKRFRVCAGARAIYRSTMWIGLAAAIAISAPVAATAQPYDVPPTWGATSGRGRG
jgi:hypothetical protein